MTWADSIKAVLWIVSIAAILFLSAGTLDWPSAWIFMAEFVIGALTMTLWLARYDPGLLKERMSGLFQKDQVFWDKVFVVFIIVVWFSWLVLDGARCQALGLFADARCVEGCRRRADPDRILYCMAYLP